jgi:Cu+-exporting ATPase
MSSTTVVKDPVCGMEVETANAAGHTEHAGQTYHFCGSACKEKFYKKPAQYLDKQAGKPKSGHCCCG